MKVLFCFVISVLLSGCSLYSAEISTHDYTLAPDEGLLIVKVQSNIQAEVMLHTEDGRVPSAVLHGLKPDRNNLRILKLKEGVYYFSRIEEFISDRYIWTDSDKESFFKVTANKVTYAGDLIVEKSMKKGKFVFYTARVDNEKQAVELAKRYFPFVFERHEYTKSFSILADYIEQ